MKIKLMTGVLAIGLLAGCGYDNQEAAAFNTNSFNNPKLIGVINGQSLYCVEVARVGHDKYRRHSVYFFKTNPVVTVNRPIQVGKTSVNTVEVFLNGMPMLKTNIPVKIED
jgi:hypothetical protein